VATSQIFLLTGDNSYELRLERRRWVQAFTDKHGGENLSVFSGDRLTFPGLLDEVCALPFTAGHRLVVVEGVPEMTREQVERLPACIHPAVVALFVDSSPDRRLGGVKALLALAEVHECRPLVGARLEAWVTAEAARLACPITPAARSLLLTTAGEDQAMLAQEISKLALYAAGRAITPEDVTLLVTAGSERNAWQMLDLIAQGDARRLLLFVHDLLDRGESPAGLWTMLLWMVSQLTGVVAAVREGARTPQDVVRSAGVKFGAARSLLPLARRLDERALERIVERFSEADMALKTGGIRASAEAPEEQHALTDVCLGALCGAVGSAPRR
jgi:DNA polymerase III subunit delta